jgi:DNA-binding NarL/FixJ family response regulator
LAAEAAALAENVEVRVLVPCAQAIIARASDDSEKFALQVLRAVTSTGNIDSFVCAYRGHPPLLAAVSALPGSESQIAEVIEAAGDFELAARAGGTNLQNRRRASGTLTRRELEVHGLISQGLTNKEIGRILFISEATAKVHVRHILEKLGVRTRTEAALRNVDDL